MIHEPHAVGACLVLVAVAALTDAISRRIPNVLTLGGLVLGLVLHGALGWVDAGAAGVLRGVAFALSGVAVCALLPLIGFAKREMGGGDVKLFAAIGALAGPSVGMDAQVFTFLVVLLVLWPWRLARAGVFRRTIAALLRKAAPPATKLAPVILGPSILVGLSIALVRHGALR